MKDDLLHKYFLGEASIEEQQQIKQWSERSNKNMRHLLEERKLFDLMLLHADTIDIEPQHRWLDSSWFKVVRRVAAVLLLLIVGGVVSYTAHLYRATHQFLSVEVPTGQRTHITLPDGSGVWLNSGSRLTYPTAFALRERCVELDGEGYFEIAHNEHKPFLVKHYAGEVEVLGTTFNLIAKAEQERYETSLVEGSVKMRTKDGRGVVLSPRQCVSYENSRFYKQPFPDDEYYDWRKGLISFKNMAFADILNRLGMVYDTKIVIKDIYKYNASYSGKFRYIDGLSYALQVLQHDIPFEVEEDTDNNILYIK